MAYKSFLAVCAGAIMLAQSASAVTTYSFFWTGDPADDPNIVSSDDASFQAVGTFEIDGIAGAAVSLADVVSASIAVTGTSISDFITSDLDAFAGVISGDGTSISLSSLFFNLSDPLPTFGCDGTDCATPQIAVSDDGVSTNFVEYNAPDNALSALRLDVVGDPAVIPLPATLSMLVAGLGALVLMRRRA